MKYGFFDDQNREYVITSPKTPWPWINYLGPERFFSMVSNTGGGYSFYKDARLRRITRYRYNNIPVDNSGKYFYIKDGNDVWSPGWKPVKKDLDQYECRHGMGYTKISGTLNGLKTDVLYFVPPNTDAEIQKVTVTNNSDSKKECSLFSFTEFCLWNSLDDMTNFQRNLNTAEVEVSGSTIFHKTEYRERRDHYAFYHASCPVDGFDTDRDSFLGLYNSPGEAEAVFNGNCTNSVASGWYPVASHQINISLAPGESRTVIFVLGYIENEQDKKWESKGVINKEKANALIEKCSSEEKVDSLFKSLTAYWNNLLSNYSISSSHEKLDRMVNVWNQYQTMITFNMSRSASYFESGVGRGMGFRDSNQDLLGFVHMAPERGRQRLIDLASTQFEDGGCYHQYQPLTKKGNNEVGGDFNDDPLWMILAVAAYIKETGDNSILDESVPFNCDPSNTASMFEHCKRSFYHVVNNRGPHGLPLIGRADWNDCMNLNCFSTTPDEPFQTTTSKDGKTAESVMIAGMFVYIGKEYVTLCQRRGLDEEAKSAQGHIDEMAQAVEKYGWDGEWYIRAYDDAGAKIGSKDNDEGKIFIESQGFCSMAQIGSDSGKPQKALDASWERLGTKHGMVLVNPAFTRYNLNLGEISTYPPGYKENAGIFCHNNPWIMIAETMLGRGDKAFDLYSRIAPAYREDLSEVHRMEPYVYSQMIAGKDAVRHGEAKNSFLTGTAAWNFVAVSQFILGVRPDYEGLVIDPCIPREWDGFTVKRVFRGKEFKITVKNPNHVSKGVATLTVEGKSVPGCCVPLDEVKDLTTVAVVVVMG